MRRLWKRCAYSACALEMELREDDGVCAKVVPPAFRLDMEREIDVVEEVVRIYGMDRFRTAAWRGGCGLQ